MTAESPADLGPSWARRRREGAALREIAAASGRFGGHRAPSHLGAGPFSRPASRTNASEHERRATDWPRQRHYTFPFTATVEGQARDQRLIRCSACRWPAVPAVDVNEVA